MRTQNDARYRNWLKRRVLGGYLHTYDSNQEAPYVTEAELALIKLVNDSLQTLAMSWDKNTERLGFKVKPHQCELCHKRSNTPHLYLTGNGIINLCAKCFKLEKP